MHNHSASGLVSSQCRSITVAVFTVFITACGGGGSSQNVGAPGVTISANPTAVAPGDEALLTWSSANATGCVASGDWSGNYPASGSESTGELATDSTYFLGCTGTGGSVSQSVTVKVTQAGISGLDFPGSSAVSSTMRFRFLNPLSIYPATYIWRAYPRQQAGYYTAFFWGNDDGAGDFSTFWWDNSNANTFYGAHPYPNNPDTSTHHWEIATDYGGDYVSPELVQYNRWYTQALVAWSDSAGKHTLFYWNLPDTSKVIEHIASASYGNINPPSPALTWGDAPWNPGREVWNGILRGIQVYSTALSVQNILSEANSPLSTSAGKSNIWYLNSNPNPDDISDKSGRGHNPEWVGNLRPELWTQ